MLSMAQVLNSISTAEQCLHQNHQFTPAGVPSSSLSGWACQSPPASLCVST